MIRSYIIRSLLSIIFLCSLLLAQNNGKISLVSRIPEGPCNSIAIKNTTAFVDNGSALDIVDVSDSSEPKKLGQILLPGVVEHLQLVGNYVYVANGRGGLSIINISNTSSPELISTVPLDSSAIRLEVSGKYAFVTNTNGFSIIDISNPAFPKILSTTYLNGSTQSLSVGNDTVFIATYMEGIYSYDVQNPKSPKLIRHFLVENYIRTNVIKKNGNFIYAIVYPEGLAFDGGLHIFKIEPDSLVEIGFVPFPGDLWSGGLDISLQGKYAYVAFNSDVGDGVCIIDISNVTAPNVIQYFWLTDTKSTFTDNNRVYVADGIGGFKIFNLSIPNSANLLSTYKTSDYTYDVAVTGSMAIIATGGGIRLVDLSIPDKPQVFGPFSSSRYQGAKSIDANEKNAFITSNYGSIETYDITAHDTAFSISTFSTIVGKALKIQDNFLYAADRDNGLYIVDITDPSNPKWLGHTSVGGTSYDLAVSGSYAYVATGSNGVQVINISDPNSPQVVSSFPVSDISLGIDIEGNRAFVGVQDLGLQIFDVSNPLSPTLISTTPIDGLASKVAVVSPYAYIATIGKGATIVDFSNVASPKVVDSVTTADSPNEIAALGNYFYIADLRGGLFIFKNDFLTGINLHSQSPSEFHLNQNYPNPFNPSTIISFAIPKQTNVSLIIYNVLGQEILKLIDNKYYTEGKYKVIWNGLDKNENIAAAGVYFYRIIAGANVSTKKMVLLK